METKYVDLRDTIAFLEARRSLLDAAIEAMKAAFKPEAVRFYHEIPDGAFFGKSIVGAIKLYLEIMEQPQTPSAICDGLKKGGLESTSKWWNKIVHASLARLEKSGQVERIGKLWRLTDKASAQAAKAALRH